MRVVLQNMNSSLYLNRIGWTSSFAEAEDFRSIHPAIDYSRQHHLQDVQIVIVLKSEQGRLVFIPFQIRGLLQDFSPATASQPQWLRDPTTG